MSRIPFPAASLREEPPELQGLRDASIALHAATNACGEAYRLWQHRDTAESTPRTRMALDEAERDVLLAWDRLRAARAALDPAAADEEPPAAKSWGAH